LTFCFVTFDFHRLRDGHDCRSTPSHRRGRQFERAAAPSTEGCGILLVSAGVRAVAEADVPSLAERLIVPASQGHRVWGGVVAADGFCQQGEFFVYARGRGIYANFFHLGSDAEGVARTHWGFFNEEELPVDLGEQRRLLQEPIPAEALAKLSAQAAAVIAATPPERVVANWSFDPDPLPSLVKGRIGLIGDAAHAMSSSQARGMTAGLEDALSLARALAHTPGDQTEALRAYGSERLSLVHDYQFRSRKVSNRVGRSRSPQISALNPWRSDGRIGCWTSRRCRGSWLNSSIVVKCR